MQKKVALISEADSAGQNFLLAKAMRDFLDWDATAYTCNETYLKYETDVLLTPENVKEHKANIESADVLIFQDLLRTIPGLRLDKVANIRNTVIYGLGSPMRNNLLTVQDWVRKGWHVLPPISDPTITKFVGGALFEAIIVDDRVFDIQADRPQGSEITICHAPTKSEKGEELFATLMTELEDVKWLVVKGKSWEDALKLKSTAQIMIDSISDESYGLNCLEGLAMDQTVVSNISQWDYVLHNDLPIHTIHNKTTKQMITLFKKLIEYCRNNPDTNYQQIRWVRSKFSAYIQAYNWQKYLNWAIR